MPGRKDRIRFVARASINVQEIPPVFRRLGFAMAMRIALVVMMSPPIVSCQEPTLGPVVAAMMLA